MVRYDPERSSGGGMGPTSFPPVMRSQSLQDHSALRCILNLYDAMRTIARWRLRLIQFDCDIQYRSGIKHGRRTLYSHYRRSEWKRNSSTKRSQPSKLKRVETTLNLLDKSFKRTSSNEKVLKNWRPQ